MGFQACSWDPGFSGQRQGFSLGGQGTIAPHRAAQGGVGKSQQGKEALREEARDFLHVLSPQREVGGFSLSFRSLSAGTSGFQLKGFHLQ